ncbi:hypothetical protein BJ508DRAFT_53669 [Ascobolus immersus RN42]|uniref:Uncharacterized protein n=1 Tax=Ascobolus immersus RN42 TaxID=1160509 RepID=A0A3N4HGS6_ASCIM|nr:hypothetical protein BJ508DRAFT_53669 [Ascobolus immersus RN42]
MSDSGRAQSAGCYSAGGNPSTTSFDFNSFISPPTSASTSSISLVSSSTTTPDQHLHQQQQTHSMDTRDLKSAQTTPELHGNPRTVVVSSGFEYPPQGNMQFETVDPWVSCEG